MPDLLMSRVTPVPVASRTGVSSGMRSSRRWSWVNGMLLPLLPSICNRFVQLRNSPLGLGVYIFGLWIDGFS
jgi:hypothetical protein